MICLVISLSVFLDLETSLVATVPLRDPLSCRNYPVRDLVVSTIASFV